MNNQIVIRQGCIADYSGLLAAEKQAWGNAEVALISQDQFESWLQVFPDGLWIAERNQKICGHLFSQICRFDPWDETDNRSWDEMTDAGFCQAAHNPAGQTMYTVSVSACVPGAGKQLLRQGFAQARRLNLQYYAGASSIPGLSQYAAEADRTIDRSLAEEYVAGVLRKLRRRADAGVRLTDPVVSITLRIEGTRFCRLLENYFHYPASGNWAVLIAYQNPDYQP